MIFWQPLRLSLLIAICGSTLFVFGQTVLSPSTRQTQVSFSDLPSNVPLPGWHTLNEEMTSDSMGKVYHYRQGDRTLSIQVQYVSGRDSNEKLFRTHRSIKPSSESFPPVLRSQAGVGSYQLSVEQGKAYLRACISSSGESIATSEDFIQSRYAASFQPVRLWRWLMGQEYLRDYRCVWSHLSVPLQGSSPDQAYQVLETTWISWHQWWANQFSKT